MAIIWAQSSEPPPPLGSLRPGLPQAVDRVFATALAKAPQDRFSTCQEFAEALQAALGLVPAAPGPPGPPADATGPLAGGRAAGDTPGKGAQTTRPLDDGRSRAHPTAPGRIGRKHTVGVAGPPATGLAPDRPGGGPGRRRTRRIIAGAAALVLAGVVGGFLVFSNSGPKVASPPSPKLAQFVPASQRVLRIYHVSLSGPVPEIVVTTITEPKPVTTPWPPEDLLLLGWDNYAQRWTLLYDAAKDPVNLTYAAEAYTSS